MTPILGINHQVDRMERSCSTHGAWGEVNASAVMVRLGCLLVFLGFWGHPTRREKIDVKAHVVRRASCQQQAH